MLHTSFDQNVIFCTLTGGIDSLLQYHLNLPVDVSKPPQWETRSCGVCNRTFNSLKQLVAHKLTVHQIERPYECEICLKTFMKNHHLKEHRFIHTGLKPHHCSVCGAVFRTASGLKRHQKIHYQHQK